MAAPYRLPLQYIIHTSQSPTRLKQTRAEARAAAHLQRSAQCCCYHRPRHEQLQQHLSDGNGQGATSRRALMTCGMALAALQTAIPAAIASSKDELRAAYDSYASTYDELDGGGAANALGFDDLREQLLSRAYGDVVEVAVGTGLNLKLYQWGPDRVQRLQALDLSQGMLSQAQARVAATPQLSSRDISFTQADATSLPLPSASADSVVDTFSLCVIQDPQAALNEMARVVRPGGRVLLLEHSKSDNPLLAAYQDLTADAVAATAKGCVWNQDVPLLLKRAGLTPVRTERHVAGTVVLVEAVRSGSALA